VGDSAQINRGGSSRKPAQNANLGANGLRGRGLRAGFSGWLL
jgi:hypothetical protein